MSFEIKNESMDPISVSFFRNYPPSGPTAAPSCKSQSTEVLSGQTLTIPGEKNCLFSMKIHRIMSGFIDGIRCTNPQKDLSFIEVEQETDETTPLCRYLWTIMDRVDRNCDNRDIINPNPFRIGTDVLLSIIEEDSRKDFLLSPKSDPSLELRSQKLKATLLSEKTRSRALHHLSKEQRASIWKKFRESDEGKSLFIQNLSQDPFEMSISSSSREESLRILTGDTIEVIKHQGPWTLNLSRAVEFKNFPPCVSVDFDPKKNLSPSIRLILGDRHLRNEDTFYHLQDSFPKTEEIEGEKCPLVGFESFKSPFSVGTKVSLKRLSDIQKSDPETRSDLKFSLLLEKLYPESPFIPLDPQKARILKELEQEEPAPLFSYPDLKC